MSEADSAEVTADVQRWAGWRIYALERLPLSPPLLLVSAAALGGCYLAFTTWLRYLELGVWEPRLFSESLTIVLISLYVMFHMRLIKRASLDMLARLRVSVRVDDAVYDAAVRRLLRADSRIELSLLALAVAVTLALVVLPAHELRSLWLQPPAQALAGVIIVAFSTLAVWLLLSLAYLSIRSAGGLGRLARQPLVINIFDPEALLPFGRLSLLQSLAIVGIVLIPILVLGAPAQAGGFLVLGLSLLSLLAMFVPLWGVHQQIVRVREQALRSLGEELFAIQKGLLADANADTERLRARSERTDVILAFRKRILDAPSWPFRDIGAIIRAGLAALSPFLTVIVTYLIQSYVLPRLGP